MKTLLFSISITLFLGILAPAFGRDPFWPIGYNGQVDNTPVATPMPMEAKATAAPQLTDAQLRALAKQESDRIRKMLREDKSSGIMFAGDKILAYVQNKWVSAGDSIDIKVQGNTYRLEILKLTSDNIELEVHRTVAPVDNQNRKQP